MNFHRRKRQKVDISLTPMIDAVFLLLIFFMVSTTFNREVQLKIILPQAQGTEQSIPTTSQPLALLINAAGEYALMTATETEPHNLTEQSSEGLKAALAQFLSEAQEQPLVITADANTPHQAVMTALDVAGQLGFSQITFAAKQPVNHNFE